MNDADGNDSEKEKEKAALATLREARTQLTQAIAVLTALMTETQAPHECQSVPPDSAPEFTLPCSDCGHEIDPRTTSHMRLGPTDARYICPACGKAVDGRAPRDTDD